MRLLTTSCQEPPVNIISHGSGATAMRSREILLLNIDGAPAEAIGGEMRMTSTVKSEPWLTSGTWLYSWLAKRVQLITVWRRRACDREMLRRLNDHYLRDIGLTRQDVMIEYKKPFWRA